MESFGRTFAEFGALIFLFGVVGAIGRAFWDWGTGKYDRDSWGCGAVAGVIILIMVLILAWVFLGFMSIVERLM